jgi:anaerobic C4-dicarboxylate transporter DcuA/anaerobic C4-dicarboxylate transporter DcuB
MDLALVLMQLAVVLAAIVMGVRTGGVGLGVWGLVGLAVLVFGFRTTPGAPPTDPVFIILTAIVAAAVMEAAGGIAWLVAVAGRVIRRNPRSIVFLAPVAAFLFTVGAGTSNVYFALLPVIYDVAYHERIRPERPLAMSTLASRVGNVCSPVSAATATLAVLLAAEGFGIGKILLVMWPASIVGLLVGALVMMRWGNELDEDPVYRRRLAAGLVRPLDLPGEGDLPPTAVRSAAIFLAGIGVIILLGLFESLRPVVGTGEDAARVSVSVTLQVVMGVVAAVIFVTCRPRAVEVPVQSVFAPGIVAAVALFGLAWLAGAFIAENNVLIVNALGHVVVDYPWTFALALAVAAMLTTSQAAATAALVPVGLAVGLGAATIVGMFPAVAAVMVLPTQGVQIGAVQFDQTGTTRIGSLVVNHSFQVPTLIFMAVAIPIGVAVANIVA